MKPYRDMFGNPLSKKDVTLAVQAAVMNDSLTTMKLSRSTNLGIGKSVRILKLLVAAKVVAPGKDGDHKVILRGFNNHAAAVNAALRQLKKGMKGKN